MHTPMTSPLDNPLTSEPQTHAGSQPQLQSIPPRGLRETLPPAGTRRWLSALALLCSTGLHGFGWQLLPSASPRLPVPPPLTVELAPLPTPEAPPPPPPPPKQPEPTAEQPKATPAKIVHPTPQPIAPSPPIEMPTSPGPVALGGIVLSNMTAPAPSEPRTATSPSPTPKAAPVAPAAPSWVPVANLSQKPRPPRLDGALRGNYPSEYRRSGTAGDASVELILSETGSVASARVTHESAPGFGEACKRTLLPSVWSAPLDASGRAVKTRVTYRCKFTVGD